MKRYFTFLLALATAEAWFFSQNSDGFKEGEGLGNFLAKRDGQYYGRPFYPSDQRRLYRSARTAYRGRELFGKRSGKPEAPEEGHQVDATVVEQAQLANGSPKELDESGANSGILVVPSEYIRSFDDLDAFRRERRRRRTQRELFG